MNERSPWTRFIVFYWQVLLGAVLITAGFAAIFLAWWGVSGTPVVAVQLTYLTSGGLGGVAGVLLGAALLVVFHLERQSVLLARIRRGLAAPQSAEAASDETVDVNFVLVPQGASRFHRPGCTYVEGKPAQAFAPDAQELSGLKPCGVCDPPVAAEA